LDRQRSWRAGWPDISTNPQDQTFQEGTSAMRSDEGGLIRFVGILALVIGCSLEGCAQQASETQKQFWPEIDIYVPLSPKFRLFFLGTNTREESVKLDTQIGAHVDYIVNKKFVLRAGYRYSFPSNENRIVLEQTLRWPLPFKILLSDRNREDLRWIDGDFSFRYRNRVTVEREFKPFKRTLTPYASAEIFYDTRFQTWNRNRLIAGIQIPLKRGFPLVKLIEPRRQLVLDLYFARQNDSRSEPHHIHAIGAALNIYF
jgi:hypothetical protein